ncbi:MAG: GNAT family N-acetyltransferase [Candidatus Eisenbacteria bacterium]|nr:GNAT family N-acetyltransferase [Candidatus Eisenbacteria bacterium]
MIELTPSLRSEVLKEKWENLLSSSSGATVFHTREWALVLKETYRDLGVKYIVIEDQDGRYVAGMPFAHSRSLFFSTYLSMPFGTYGGPVVIDGLEEDVAPFIGVALQGITRGVFPFSFYCVTYNTPVLLERAVQGAFPQGRRTRVSTHLIELGEGFGRLWDSSFDKETRTCARKALRNGVRIEKSPGGQGAAALHSLYKEQAAAWGVRKVYPERLVCQIAELMGDKASIWIGALKGAPVCAVLVFHFKDVLMAWLSGQNAEGRRVCASHLLYSEILKDACEKGYSVFNFGGSGKLQGIRYFKESFGGREYFYSLFINESGVFKSARKLRRITTGHE